MAETDVTLVMKLRDEMSAGFKRIEGAGAKSMKKLETSASTTEKAVMGVNKAMGAFASVAVVGGILNQVKAINEERDAILNLSNATGIAVSTLSTFDHIATINKTSSEAMTNSLKKLAMTVGQAEMGSKTAVDTFASLGIELNNNQGELKDLDTLFFESIDALQNTENATERLTKAQLIFGRNAAELGSILDSDKESLEALAQEARDLGIAFDRDAAEQAARFNDELARLQASLKGVAMSISGVVTPALTGLATTYREIIEGFKSGEVGGIFSSLAKLSAPGALINTIGNIKDAYNAETAKNAEKIAKATNSISKSTGGGGDSFDGGGWVDAKTIDKGNQERLKAVEDGNKAIRALEEEQEALYEAGLQDRIDTANALAQGEIEAKRANAEIELSLEKEIAEKRLEIAEQNTADMKVLEDNMLAYRKQVLMDTLSGYSTFFGGFASLMAATDEMSSKRRKALKGFLVAEAVANTALGITKTLSSYPFPFSLIPAAGVAAAGAAQISNIKNQKFRDGGVVGGTTRAGDQTSVMANKGEMILNDAQQNNLFDMINGGAGGVTVNINASNAVGLDLDKLALVTTNATKRALNTKQPARLV